MCQGLNFVPLDGTSILIGSVLNITEEIQKLPPLLTGRATPFKEVLNWLQFAYTADRMGS